MSYEQKESVRSIHCAPCVCLGWSSIGAGPEFKSNADDLTEIRSVLEEFRQDIIHKDGYALTKLVLNPDVLFHHINNQEEVDGAPQTKTLSFDGVGPSQLDGFVNLLATSGRTNSMRNFAISRFAQDGDLGLVTFNYDFVINDKVQPFRPRTLAGVQN